jgi:SAM-dependent methyltransferase
MSKRPRTRPVPVDYDTQPGRFQLAREVLSRHGAAADVHAAVAARFVAHGMLPVLDVGCGTGELARHLPAGAWTGIDSSPAMVAGAPTGARLGRADSLPFADGSFGGVALLYVLYHLDDPAIALQEARRVGRRGGLVATAAPSRHDSPELAFALPRRSLPFDAEIAPQLLAEQFDAVEVDTWDLPLLTLPDRQAVRDYLIGKGTNATSAADAASEVEVPLTVTKRGALVWGRI